MHDISEESIRLSIST